MKLLDRATHWHPVPDERPCSVWRPAQGPTAPGPAAAATVVQLAWSGDIDVTADLRTQAQLDDLLQQRETRAVAIDLSQVTHLSLSTLRALVDVDRRLRARGGRLHLLHPRPPVLRLLAVTHTTHLCDEGRRPAPSAAPCRQVAPPEELLPERAAVRG